MNHYPGSLLLAIALLACSEPPTPRGVAATGPSSGDGASTPAPDPTGEGGGAAEPGTGGAAVAEPVACTGDAAFWATGMSFTEPTPRALADALHGALFGYDAHGVSVVLSGDAVAASATVVHVDGEHRFTSGPDFASIHRDAGGFATTEPQARGWLRLGADDDAPTVELHNVVLTVRASADCGQLFVVLDAVLPTSEGDATVWFDGQWQTLKALAGGGESITGWPVRTLFQGEAISFDFASLAP